MATIHELREKLEPKQPTMGHVVLRLVDIDDFKMVCLECNYQSATVSEYDEIGLEEIAEWALRHICVVWEPA